MLKKIKTVLLIAALSLSFWAFCACAPKTETFTVTVSGGTGGGEYASGSECTVTAVIDDGSEFLRWEENGVTVSESNPYTFTVSRNISLTAVTELKSTKEYTVTVSGGTGGGTFPAGASVTVTADVGAGEKFVGWFMDGVNVSSDVSYTFTVEKDTALTAVTAPLATAGAFNGKWVSADKTLDLSDMTLTGAEEFYLTDASGEGAETVLNAVIDGAAYTFSLNKDGRLILKSLSDGTETEFMPYDARFNGLWTIEDSDIYTLFIQKADKDGNFGWTLINADGSLYDEDLRYTAKTRLVFDGVKPVVQFVSSANIVYVVGENGFVTAPDENLVYIPADVAFYDFYVTQSGRNIKLDTSAKTVSVEGKTFNYNVTTCEYGSCIRFIADKEECFLVYSTDGAVLYGTNESENAVKADLTSLTGEWVGAVNFTVDGENVYIGGERYEIKGTVKENAVVFSFTADDVTYGLYPVGYGKGVIAVADLKTDRGVYCVSKAVADAFKGEYGALTVGGDYSVTLDGVTKNAFFTALPDFERALNEPSGLEDIGIAALCVEEGSYLVWAEEGVLALIEKSEESYIVSRAFYSADATEKLKTSLKAGLNSESDLYTTGGTNPVTVSLDFDGSRILYNGAPYPFEYGYYIRLCHNKQLINSHFYRGVSELPYKLLFAVIYTHLEFRYEMSHTITSHHVHHFHQTRIPDGTLLDYMVQYRKPLFPQFFLYPKKFLPENNPHHKEFHLRPYIQNNANQ